MICGMRRGRAAGLGLFFATCALLVSSAAAQHGDHSAAIAAMDQGLLGGGGVGDGIAGNLVDKLKAEGGDHTSVWTEAGSQDDGKAPAVGEGGGGGGGEGGTGAQVGGGLFGFNPSGFTMKQASSGELLNQLKLEAKARIARKSDKELHQNEKTTDADLSQKSYAEQGPSSAWPRPGRAQQQLMQQESGWGYSGAFGPSEWGKIAPTCAKGKQQSPIMIDASLAVPVTTRDLSSIALLTWQTSPAQKQSLTASALGGGEGSQKIFLSLPVNSRFQGGRRRSRMLLSSDGSIAELPSVDELYAGHEFEVENLGAPTLFVDGARYALRKVVTRTPSEHIIEGQGADLEVQFLHEPEGAGPHQHRGVGVSVLFGASGSGASPSFVSKLAAVAPGATRVAKQLVEGLTFGDIEKEVGESLKEYYRYEGSLTTPPCTEGVAWFVARRSLPVSAKDVAKLRMAEGHNNRPLQSVNGRTVQSVV